jgi:hypothetical protein
MILSVNSDYFLKQQPTDLFNNGEVLCFFAVRTQFLNTV